MQISYACKIVMHSAVPGISDVLISENGILSWDTQTTNHSLYFRVRVSGKGQRASYHNIFEVSVKYYDLTSLKLSPGDYSVQV